MTEELRESIARRFVDAADALELGEEVESIEFIEVAMKFKDDRGILLANLRPNTEGSWDVGMAVKNA